QNLATSMGGNVMGPSLVSTALGSSMVPTTYATSSISNTTFTNPLASNNPTALPSSFNNPTFTSSVTNTLNQFNLHYNPVTTTFTNNVTFSNPLSSQFNSLGLSGPMSIKLKPLDEVELGELRYVAPRYVIPPNAAKLTLTSFIYC